MHSAIIPTLPHSPSYYPTSTLTLRIDSVEILWKFALETLMTFFTNVTKISIPYLWRFMRGLINSYNIFTHFTKSPYKLLYRFEIRESSGCKPYLWRFMRGPMNSYNIFTHFTNSPYKLLKVETKRNEWVQITHVVLWRFMRGLINSYNIFTYFIKSPYKTTNSYTDVKL